MMAWAINSFSNNSSSILQQKFQGAIQDQLSSPASPLELLLAFSLGGFMRGLIVAVLTFIAASLLVDLPVDHILVLIPALFLVGFFFSQLGVLIGVRAEQFDDVAFAQTFVLTPLIFLGGVFYSAALLPEPFQTLTHFNPVYYMINLVRYGFLGFTEVEHRALAAGADGGDRGAVRLQPAPVLARLQAQGLNSATSCGSMNASSADDRGRRRPRARAPPCGTGRPVVGRPSCIATPAAPLAQVGHHAGRGRAAAHEPAGEEADDRRARP